MTEPTEIIPSAVVHLPMALPDRSNVVEAFENFFQGELRNANTRRAYEASAEEFLRHVFARAGIIRLGDIKPYHISAWLDGMTANGMSAPTVKQRLAGLGSLFDSLVRQHIMIRNPAEFVQGPSHIVRKGKSPVLTGDEMAQFIAAIDIKKHIGLRDRAMIGMMAYSFARISAVTELKVGDVFHQKRRLWLRLKEKRGKVQDVPCHHLLENYIDEWLQAAGHRIQLGAPLFQTFARRGARKPDTTDETDDEHNPLSGKKLPKTLRPLSGKPMTQAMTWEMVQRRAKSAGLKTEICNHTFRATGITAYLTNGGTIERAAIIAGHASINTTKIYDRRSDDVTLDEIEKIRFA